MIGSTKIDLEARIHSNRFIMCKKAIEIEKKKSKKDKSE